VAQVTQLDELPPHAVLGYLLRLGESFCADVRNDSGSRLRVTLLNCASSVGPGLEPTQAIE
jgi:hypothetical protein